LGGGGTFYPTNPFKQEGLRMTEQNTDTSYSFFVEADGHSLHSELLHIMLKTASTSDDIEVIEQSITGYNFYVKRNAETLPIVVRGLAGAHEFTPLLYSLLNARSHPDPLDSELEARIEKLPGSIRVTAYVSLFCSKSPDVVQSLSRMALAHHSFQLEIVEQTQFLDEFTERNIQTLPSIYIGEELIHDGPASLTELLHKIEIHNSGSSGI
jgi:alkyl hydroperoxide reductase subunit F